MVQQAKPNTGGTALLFTTKDDLENWTYKGQLFEIQNQPGDLGSVGVISLVTGL